MMLSLVASVIGAVICACLLVLFVGMRNQILYLRAIRNALEVNDKFQDLMWAGHRFPVTARALQPRWRSIECWEDGVSNIYTHKFEPVLNNEEVAQLNHHELNGRTAISQHRGEMGEPLLHIAVYGRNRKKILDHTWEANAVRLHQRERSA